MIYSLNGSNILITNNDDVNYTQERNPVTQEYFKNEQEAIEWGKGFLNNYLGATPIEIALTAQTNVLSFDATFELNAIVLADVVENDEVIKTIEIEFIDGKGSYTSLLPEGTYELCFNKIISDTALVPAVNYYCFHEKKQYIFTI